MKVVLCFTALLLMLLTAGCDSELLQPDVFVEAQVVRVVDGDTIIVNIEGVEERVRYIGIDTPESVDPNRPVQCYGPEAAAENTRLVGGKSVFLEDDKEDRDQYGRLLRYVYVDLNNDVDLTFVNMELVRHGFARAGEYPPNRLHENDLFLAQEIAQDQNEGLWSACQ